MIILKSIIRPAGRDFWNSPKSILYGVNCYERDYKKGLSCDESDLIEKISYYHGFNDFNINLISSEVPVYLDKEDNSQFPDIEIKKKDIENYIKDLKREIKRLENDKDQEDEYKWVSRVLRNWEERLKSLDPNSDTFRMKNYYTRCGYYTRGGRDHNPEIVLLMETIGSNKQLLISTYVHEMFHAYYDLYWIKDQNNPKYKKKVNLTYIEEPLTEYAMLKFLDEFVRTNPEYADLLNVSIIAKDVREKQLSPGICHYGFGYYLWKWEKDGYKPLCDWIKCYKEAKFEIRNSNDKRKFDSLFSKGFYPYGKEYDSMELLRKILTEDKSKQQNSNNVSAGGGIMNKGKKGHLRGWYL